MNAKRPRVDSTDRWVATPGGRYILSADAPPTEAETAEARALSERMQRYELEKAGARVELDPAEQLPDYDAADPASSSEDRFPSYEDFSQEEVIAHEVPRPSKIKTRR